MAQPSLQSMPVPFTTHINGMFPGRKITLRGTVRPEAKGFGIHLATGAEEGADIAFKANPQFQSGYEESKISCNFRIARKWQIPEEWLFSGGKFPFAQGHPFDITVICHDSNYEVYSNGKQLCDFSHKFPSYKVSHLKVTGGITIQAVDFDMPNELRNSAKVFSSPNSNNAYPIPFPSLVGHTVKVIGKPKQSENGFAINFKTDDDHTALHINPRFNENAVVRNTKYGNWQREERGLPDEFPFAKNSPFLVEIAVNSTVFVVSLNGVHLFDYKHRLPIDRVKKVHLRKDAHYQELLFY